MEAKIQSLHVSKCGTLYGLVYDSWKWAANPRRPRMDTDQMTTRKNIPSRVYRSEIAELAKRHLPSEVAAMFGICVKTVRNIKREFGLPANRVGGVRIYGAELHARGRNRQIAWPLRPRGQARLEWAA